MKQIEMIRIESSADPIIEWDEQCGAVYIRFKPRATKVVKTLDRSTRGQTITIDLDKNDEVIGIEAIPATEVRITNVLKIARVEAPQVDWSRATSKSLIHT